MKQRKANRLKGYDYSQDNLYFVTSCVHDMICCFGHVGTGRDLSGNIGRDLSGNTGRDLSGNGDQNAGSGPSDNDNRTGRDLSLQEPCMILNEYGKIADQQWYWLATQYPYVVLHEFIVMPNHIHGIIEINRNASVGTGRDLSLPPKIKSLSDLIGAYKTTVSKQIHLLGYAEFAWQRSFHDHIIRDEESYERISNYIINNPNSWYQDKFFRR